MASKFNKSDNPLKKIEDLNNEVLFESYEFKGEFEYACTIAASGENEKFIITHENKELMEKSCVYIMVLNRRIFKIGSALRGIKGRIGSYNSGRTRYRIRSTNSGANYWVLHSLINIGQPVKFYIYYPQTKKCIIFGEEALEPFPSAKSIEGVVIRKFEETYGKKPIGCTQG